MAVTSEEIRALIAEESGIAEADLRDDATLDDLDITSLDIVSALFELEDRYHVDVQPDELKPDATLGEVVEFIRMKIAAG